MTGLLELTEQPIWQHLPANVTKVIQTAISNDWQLNGKGFTVALRLDKPTDPLAQPFYIMWDVGSTAKGAISFRFGNAATVGLQPLSAADVLTYLKDPTVIYPEDSSAEQA